MKVAKSKNTNKENTNTNNLVPVLKSKKNSKVETSLHSSFTCSHRVSQATRSKEEDPETKIMKYGNTTARKKESPFAVSQKVLKRAQSNPALMRYLGDRQIHVPSVEEMKKITAMAKAQKPKIVK